MTRVALFVDYQNVYMQARECYGSRYDPPAVGQVIPLRTGVLLTARGREVDAARALSWVHVYRGEPSPKHSPKGLGAAQRQVAAWRSQPLVSVTTRPLHYYHRGVDRLGAPVFEAREKGVDVLIALGLVLGAERDDYDVAVLFSSDTDLVPAVEAVRTIGKRCEVAAWRPAVGYGNGLRIGGVWCHWLDEADYRRLHDPTNYASGEASR